MTLISLGYHLVLSYMHQIRKIKNNNIKKSTFSQLVLCIQCRELNGRKRGRDNTEISSSHPPVIHSPSLFEMLFSSHVLCLQQRKPRTGFIFQHCATSYTQNLTLWANLKIYLCTLFSSLIVLCFSSVRQQGMHQLERKISLSCNRIQYLISTVFKFSSKLMFCIYISSYLSQKYYQLTTS